MITVIKSIINWFSNNFKVIAVCIMSIFTAIIFLQQNQLKKQDKELDRLNNNIFYYQEQCDSVKNSNRTLQLTVEEFDNSKDSIIRKLNDTRKELNIKKKQLKQAQYQQQQIKLDTTIIVKQDDFKEVIKPNELTSIIIAKTDSILTAKIDIKNEQTLFIQSKKEYKRQYKNWFRRLLKFDFKKQTIFKYQIYNSNNIIKVTDTKLVTIE